MGKVENDPFREGGVGAAGVMLAGTHFFFFFFFLFFFFFFFVFVFFFFVAPAAV